MVALFPRDVEMGHSANGPPAEGDDEDAAHSRARDHRGRVGRFLIERENHDIGFNRIGGQPYVRVRAKPGCYTLRVRMIFDEAFTVMIERIQTGGTKNSDLTHRAPEHPAMAVARMRCRLSRERSSGGTFFE